MRFESVEEMFRRPASRFPAHAAVEHGRPLELPPHRELFGSVYKAFVDPSGGSNDSMTLGIAHKEGATVILDAIREAKP